MNEEFARLAKKMSEIGSPSIPPGTLGQDLMSGPPTGTIRQDLLRGGLHDPRTWQGINTAQHYWLQQQKQGIVTPLDAVDRSLARVPDMRLPAYQLPESMKALVDVSKGVGSYLAQLNEMVEKVAQTMAEPIARIAEFGRAAALQMHGWKQLVANLPTSWNFQGFWEGFQPILQQIQIVLEEAETGREVLKASEFGFADHFWGIFYVRGFAHIPERVRPAVVTNRLASFTSSDSFVGELADTIGGSPLMRGRWRIVEAICEAHASKKYAVAVPAALAQIEGTLVDLMFLKDLVRKENNKFYLVDENGERKRNPHNNKKLGPVTLGPAITNAKLNEHPTLAASSEFIADTIVQRRNDVLHGRDLGYAKAKFSVQAMLLLAVLSQGVSHLESGDVTPPFLP